MLLLYWSALLWRNTLKPPMNHLSQNQVAIVVIKYEGIDIGSKANLCSYKI